MYDLILRGGTVVDGKRSQPYAADICIREGRIARIAPEGGEEAREVVDALLACGPRSVVITSGLEAETGRHVVWGYCHRQGRYFTLPFDFIQVHFPGTGDVFSAVLIGELLAGTGLEQAAQKAMDTVERLVCLDRNEVEKNKGIRIERFLKELDL